MSEFSFSSRRSAVHGKGGMVATSQPLAVAAGLEILRQGGNAADTAVATAAALNVTEPTSTGIGGDAFALYYDSATGKISALNASGRAPQSLTLEKLQKEGFSDELPPYHPYTITVPGACGGWSDLVERYGRLSFADVLQPAIRLAEEGFPVAPITAYFWARGAKRQLKKAANGVELTIEGHAPQAGEIFRNPGLAKTLKSIAMDGKKVFYEGEIGEAIIRVIKESGGAMQMDDLATHTSTWETPISTTYRDLDIWECPPNGQGLTALLALNILEGFDLDEYPALSPERLHLMIEAMRIAFADSRWYVSDPTFNNIPLDELLSKAYADTRRKLIHPQKATLDQQFGTPVTSSDTVYLSVVDGNGNACSFINSNYMGFGTGIVPKGWGFTLQNRGHNFSLDDTHPNSLAPGKRPYHTIIPTMATRKSDQSLFASFGVMGGFMQPQGHTQVVIAMVDDLLDPQAALDRPRFCITDGTSDGKVALEEGIPEPIMAELSRMGHPTVPTSGYARAIFGRGQIILRNTETGRLTGGSDPRADGLAMTL